MVFGSHAREQRQIAPDTTRWQAAHASLITRMARSEGAWARVYEIPAGVSVVTLRLWRLPLILPP